YFHTISTQTFIILAVDIVPFLILQAHGCTLAKQYGSHLTFKGGFASWAIFDFMFDHAYPFTAKCCRADSLAAATMISRDFFVSLQFRVFNPQSGFTHSWSAGITDFALSKSRIISSLDGTLGE